MKLHLLLLHGALGSKSQFDELAKLLEPHFNLHTFNFDGHGGENITENFSIGHFKENLYQYIRNNKLEGCNVFGYSMGGYVALKLAIDHPEMINKIMTLGTKFMWTLESSEKEIKKLNPEIVEEKVPQFAEALKKIHHPVDWKMVMNKTAEMMLKLGNGMAIEFNEFRKINNEVLICLGSDDKMVTVEESKTVAELLVNGKMIVINNLPHAFEMVDKVVLAEVIVEAML